MKKTCNQWNPILLLGLLALIIFCPACYEPSEACLDIYASNFDANADNPCEDDCCTYPNLRFAINHLYGEDGMRYDSVFFDNGTADSIRFVQIIYYMSEVALDGLDGPLTISDQVNVTLESGAKETITDDFAIVDYIKGREYTLGKFKTAGAYDTLSFRLGLSPQLLDAQPSSLPENHELSVQTDTLWEADKGYALARVRLVSQANNNDTLQYYIPANNSLVFGFPLDLKINFGVSTDIGLNVDYQKWLAGIDFVTIGNDEAAVVAEIVKNLPNSISLAE